MLISIKGLEILVTSKKNEKRDKNFKSFIKGTQFKHYLNNFLTKNY